MWYRVPQYGHIASPVAATSRKTRGWLDHSGIAGFGQYSGRSAAVTSTAARVGVVAFIGSRQTSVSQDRYLAFLPCTASKNNRCSFRVIGPHSPDPMVRLSSSRIGVTSAAVPVKNASSAI